MGSSSNFNGTLVHLSSQDAMVTEPCPAPAMEPGESPPPCSPTEEARNKLHRMLAAEDLIRRQTDHQLLCTSSSLSSSGCQPSIVWREKVAQWCYDVADRLGEGRSCVYVAMNVLDRYCAHFVASERAMDERTYEVASMTSLFLAIRISGSGNLRIQDLLSMSRDGITPQDIVLAGTHMIRVLTWNHRIVTPFDFVSTLLDNFPATSSSSSRETIHDSACYLIELAVCDSALSGAKASHVALAAVLNAMRAEFWCHASEFATLASATTNIDPESEVMTSLRNRLHRLYSLSYDNRSTTPPHIVPDDEDEELEVVDSFRSSVAVRNISEGSMCCPASE